MEQWKDIPGYEGKYRISNYGNVWNVKKDRYHEVEKIWSGYLRTTLCKDGKAKHYSVHRLVAEAFVPNPNEYPQVNHVDEIKWNNKATNLEWVTGKQNANYGTRNEKLSRKMRNNHLSMPVVQLTTNGEVIAEYPSIAEASRHHGYHIGTISAVCRGIGKTAHGYVWKYKKDMG